MIGFHITFHGQEITAGLEQGVTTVIVTRVKNKDRDELSLDIGGMDTQERRYPNWLQQRPLQIGDEIVIKVSSVDSVSNYTVTNEFTEEDKEQQLLKAYHDIKGQLEEKGLI